MRKALFSLIVLVVLLAPSVAGAVSWIPIVTCGGSGQVPCTPCSLVESFKNIIDLVLYGITGPIAAFMIVWAGGMMLLGGGKPSLYSEGKTMLTNVLIGVTIILLSWLATNFLIKTLMTGNQGDGWNEFSCPAGLSAITPIETVLPTGGPQFSAPPAVEMVPQYAGVAVLGVSAGSGANPLCPNIFVCPKNFGCSKLRPLLTKYPDNAKLLESIMYHESSCLIKPRPSGAGAYGLMQMKPETANANRNGCNVTEKDSKGNAVPVAITEAWLTSEANVEKIVCVANNVVNSLKRACGNTALNIAAGYNGGPGACAPSRDCPGIPSCLADGSPMRRWECPWNNRAHTIPNEGKGSYQETRNYAPKVAMCAQ